MVNTTVRIESIEIRNFKNVGYGYLNFESAKKGGKASILGLYGQNGSGKTALIDALELLRLALSGKAVPAYFADYINIDSKYATIKYDFKISRQETNSVYSAFYQLNLRRDIDSTEHNTDQLSYDEHYKAVIFDELLSSSYECAEKKVRLSRVIDTRTNEDVVFVPDAKYHSLVGGDKETLTSLLVAKQLTSATSRSFIFSRELLNAIRKNRKENCKEDPYFFLIENLVVFGNFRLFVINTANSGLISMNALPLAFNYAENGKASIGNIIIKLNEPSLIPEDTLNIVHKVIDCMNVVLKQLIPGLTISVKDMGPQLFPTVPLATVFSLCPIKTPKKFPCNTNPKVSKN